MLPHIALLMVSLILVSPALAQDVSSGPPRGQKVPPLKVQTVTGPDQGRALDYAAARKDKVTVYVLIPADKFSRPMHRFLKGLGEAVQKKDEDGLVVAVWLTEDQAKTRAYLPKIAGYYQSTALTYFPGARTGPAGWNINDLADVTVVVSRKGQVLASGGYNSVNETVVREVMKPLAPRGGTGT